MSVQLYLGDCLEVMKSMPENSVDTCITDPPYELGFMGKKWDSSGIAFQPETWAEVYRLLKPGGLLLAFGGTRTYHRMVCAIEDAGFEIRDTIAWVYGSGFPKSYDISKGIDKQAGAEREVVGYTNRHVTFTDGTGNSFTTGMKGIDAETGRTFETAPSTPEAQLWHGWGTALKPAWESIVVAVKPYNFIRERGIIVESLKRLENQLWSLLPANIAEKNFKLSQNEYEEACDSAQWTAEEKQRILDALLDQMDMLQLESAIITSLNIVSLWKSTLEEALNSPNMFTTEMESSLITDLKILNSLLLELTPQSIILDVTTQLGKQSRASTVASLFNAVKTKAKYIRTLSVQESATSKERLKDLRPELTPIVVAMKPVDGTYVNNALTWGVAGMWIDGGRVGTEGARNNGNSHGTVGSNSIGVYGKAIKQDYHKGRFPANLIHDGSDEVLAVFPHSNGAAAPVAKGQKEFGGVIYGKFKTGGDDGASFYGDSGSAARFFYCAKASRSERNAGLEGTNHHPTIKPIELMRYLVRLTKTPTGGVVLDPFMGSGTTGIACELEGRDFIGIEREQDYFAIAEKRIAEAQKQPRLEV